MDFSLSDDHLALGAALRRYCDDTYAAQHRGNVPDAGTAATRRAGLAELGLFGLAVPAECEGSGLATVELMLAAQELGRALADEGWLASAVLCAPLLARAASVEQQQRWLVPAAQGRLRLALAYGEAEGRYHPTHIATTARATADGYVLDGRKSLVLAGADADLYLVVARVAGNVDQHGGLALFAVPAGSHGLTVQGFATLDGRGAAHLALNAVAVTFANVIGLLGAVTDLLEETLDRGAAVVCGETVGALEALLDATLEHLRTRKQFGQPLARFQVLQHRVADLFSAIEQLKSMACAAAMAVDAGEPVQRRRIVSAAKVLMGQLGRRAGNDVIQMHGAMGMTDECRVGHYVKRLMVNNGLFGDAHHHLGLLTAREPVGNATAT